SLTFGWSPPLAKLARLNRSRYARARRRLLGHQPSHEMLSSSTPRKNRRSEVTPHNPALAR
ncbi:MAG: hypothetical protein ACE5MG_13320, partial [Candidatus Methylomirabilales bacterium]